MVQADAVHNTMSVLLGMEAALSEARAFAEVMTCLVEGNRVLDHNTLVNMAFQTQDALNRVHSVWQAAVIATVRPA